MQLLAEDLRNVRRAMRAITWAAIAGCIVCCAMVTHIAVELRALDARLGRLERSFDEHINGPQHAPTYTYAREGHR